MTSFFSPDDKRQWKQGANLGRPSVIGHGERIYWLHRDILEQISLLPQACWLRCGRQRLLVRLPQSSKQAPKQVSKAPETTNKRLSTGLPRLLRPRTSGLTPLQAEDVEFETRLASYSDDELSSINTKSRKMSKKERRWSKDDARVDILVASHSHRAGNQDAVLRRPGGPRARNASRQDTEVASQEVLAGIRGP